MNNNRIQTFEDLANVLWLTLILVAKDEVIDGESRIDFSIPEPPVLTPAIPKGKSEDTGSPKQPRDGFPATLVSVPADVKKFPNGVLPFSFAPIPKTNISALGIQRGLKPLKKRVPSSAMPMGLDVERTLEQLAKNYIYAKTLEVHGSQRKISLKSDIPALTQGKERWLDLVLIIDTSSSMQFFAEQVDMVVNATAQSGIFRKVETYYLSQTTVNGYPRPEIQKKNYAGQPETFIEKELSNIVDMNGRKVFLVLSSCTSRMWHDWTIAKKDVSGRPSIGQLIYDIGRNHPVAILQMLPERLWYETGISYFEYCKAWASTALAPNINLKLSVTPNKGSGFAVPILSLDSQSILSWATMLTGKTNLPVLSMYVADEYTHYPRKLESIERSTELKERLELFLGTAPKQLMRFVGYLSVMPDLTIDNVRQIQKDLFPDSTSLTSDLLADLAAIGMFDAKIDGQIKIFENISSSAESHWNRPLFWETMSYPNRLQGMAYYYEFIAKSKFYDRNNNQVGFWVYLDDRVAREYEIHAKDKDGEKMLRLFEGVIQWSTQIKVYIPGGIQAYPFPGINELPMQTKVDSTPNMESAEAFDDNELPMPTKIPSEPNMKLAEASNDFDFSYARLINDQDYSYLRLPCLNIGVWGDSGVGKTTFLMSMARDFLIHENSQFLFQVVDHYGNTSQHPNMYVKPNEFDISTGSYVAKDMRDQLVSLSGFVGKRSMQRLFCFHDFPGKDTIAATTTVKVAYKNCDALFLFLSAENILSPTSRDKATTTQNLSVLLNWLQNKQANAILKYVALVVTKAEFGTANVLANAKDPWDYMHGYLDGGILQTLKQKINQVFVTSSFGNNKSDWKPNNTRLPLLWLWEQENLKLINR